MRDLLLCFSWPPACAVWPNYEVLLLQPISGTTKSLGLVPNITSYLKSAPPFNCLMDIFSSPSVSWLTPPSATLRLSYTTILSPDYPPSISFLDRLYTWTDVHPHRPPPPVLRLLSCHPRPALRVTLGPFSPFPRACFYHLSPCRFAPLATLTTSVDDLF